MSRAGMYGPQNSLERHIENNRIEVGRATSGSRIPSYFDMGMYKHERWRLQCEWAENDRIREEIKDRARIREEKNN